MCFLVRIALLLLPLSVFAQTELYNFYKLDTYNGLSHNQVSAILKDPDGFLWFGTLSGLNRYDGYSCRIFRKNYSDSTSLLDNSVQALYELPDDKLWVVTAGGPCIYNASTEKFSAGYNGYLRSLGLPAAPVTSIIKGNSGRYWFLYDNLDLYLYTAGDKKARLFKRAPDTSSLESVTAIKEAKDGKLWVVYQTGLLQQYDIQANKIVFESAAFESMNVGTKPSNLFVDNDGDVWLWGVNNGAFLFQPKSNTVRQFNESSYPSRLNRNLVTQIVQDNNGLIWVSTDHGGVNLVSKKNNFSISYLRNDPKDRRSLSQNSITATYKDDDGIIWLGTYKHGVNYLNSNIVLFPVYRHQEADPNSLPYDDVDRFVEDSVGNLWIGTNGGGLIWFDRKRNVFRQFLHDPNNPSSLSSNVIVSLLIDHEGILWIGTYFGGLCSYDGRGFTRYRHSDTDSSSLSSDNVWDILEDRQNNLWIGTLGGGLDQFDRNTKRFGHTRYKGALAPLPSNYISGIIEDGQGNLWVGSTAGLTVFDRNKTDTVTYQHTDNKKSLSNNTVNSVLEDNQGRIWAGTREGLNLLNRQTGEFQRFSTADGLPDDLILDILEDNQGTLWISTPNGLCNVIPTQDQQGIRLSVIRYDETNNLQSREFNDNAAFKTRAGELVFGGPSGFNIIQPEKIRVPVFHPKLVLTGLQLLNNTVEPGEVINNRVLLEQSLSKLPAIELKHKENVFSIDFTTLDFGQSSGSKYAYMLQGFNADWLYTDGTQRRATYTNLNPGHYTFKVKVMRRDGTWSAEKTLGIRVLPPFWQTPLAYAVYALVLLGIFLLIRKITLDRIHLRFEMRQQRSEAERALALDQLKTKFFTNVSHEFRTPLSLIISPLDKIIKNTADEDQQKQLNLVLRNAKRLLNLVNQLLDFRKIEVQGLKLHPAIGDIVLFARDITGSFSDMAEKKNIRLSFQANVEQLEIYFDKDKVEKILFNLLSNAFKYTHDNGRVQVNLVYTPGASEDNGILAIAVEDTGIGIPADMQEKVFERFFQTDVPAAMVNQGTGIGLAITKEFVKLHGGTITVNSEPEKGTCFTVMLPAKKIYEPTVSSVIQPVVMEEGGAPAEEQSHGKRKTILVIEDNEDIRFYLKENLRASYQVEEAVNGKEGWEKIKLINPDLVVSDMMMPLVDGIELAKKIKTDTLTAHIPVILLTAMGSEEKQIEGFQAGVSDYITKPFTFEILASRIKNLLARQHLLQKRFQKQIDVNPGEVTVTPVDEQFLKQALGVVEKYMDNPDFSVEDFSREMCLSRKALYNKISSLTGKAPLDFIRSIRLKRAAQLLAKSGMTISEIAWEVGFNNPKNFTKYFKEEFDVLPSQYRESLSK
ncbi:hybrid sensor histidine kinase/response regulator transcription factor [Flavihumibacter petaseus]|uniref:histidine kinase n=1 Tax=Flavihumibacter petaseus NBRC 106054 TaxID=1220578 RepID=A0A0E9MY27_9BACT|nr:two-component regulator propeller domain-containing protein [Flavihumibacter petaseus]GAO42346.1 putative two-component hybrid sensor and regulator [Flavihumibacter petaseus NBRC 106054]